MPATRKLTSNANNGELVLEIPGCAWPQQDFCQGLLGRATLLESLWDSQWAHVLSLCHGLLHVITLQRASGDYGDTSLENSNETNLIRFFDIQTFNLKFVPFYWISLIQIFVAPLYRCTSKQVFNRITSHHIIANMFPFIGWDVRSVSVSFTHLNMHIYHRMKNLTHHHIAFPELLLCECVTHYQSDNAWLLFTDQ